MKLQRPSCLSAFSDCLFTNSVARLESLLKPKCARFSARGLGARSGDAKTTANSVLVNFLALIN